MPAGGAATRAGWLAAGIGFAFGCGFYVSLLPWVGEFVGPVPYLGLSFALAFYTALGGPAMAYALRHRWGLVAVPFIFGLVEFCQSSFPFGGFAWVRLAWGQVDGPLAALVTMCVGVIAAGLAALALQAARAAGTGVSRRAGVASRGEKAGRVAAGAGAVAIILTTAAGFGAGMTVDPDETRQSSVRVAAIQGNVPRLGLDFNAQARAVLNNHVRETLRFAGAAEAEGSSAESPDGSRTAEAGEAATGHADIVFWPENAADVSPLADPLAAGEVQRAIDAVDAPLLVGTVTRDDAGVHNTMLAYDTAGSVTGRHDKKYLQPFGETMPMREFFRLFSPLVDQAGNMIPGTGDGTVQQLGGVTVGVATCYEVIFDAAFRDTVRAGAQLLTTPTNNATFGFTDMTYQQLAMSRMRAIEFDRAVVVPATSGASAIVAPDGTVLGRTRIFEAAHLTAELPLKSGLTPAVHLGSPVQAAIAIIGVTFSALALFGPVRNRIQRSTRHRGKPKR